MKLLSTSISRSACSSAALSYATCQCPDLKLHGSHQPLQNLGRELSSSNQNSTPQIGQMTVWTWKPRFSWYIQNPCYIAWCKSLCIIHLRRHDFSEIGLRWSQSYGFTTIETFIFPSRPVTSSYLSPMKSNPWARYECFCSSFRLDSDDTNLRSALVEYTNGGTSLPYHQFGGVSICSASDEHELTTDGGPPSIIQNGGRKRRARATKFCLHLGQRYGPVKEIIFGL